MLRSRAITTRADQSLRRDRRNPLERHHRLAAEPLENGLLGATNSLAQAAKRRARGYRNKEKMITIIHLVAGKLPQPEIHTI